MNYFLLLSGVTLAYFLFKKKQISSFKQNLINNTINEFKRWNIPKKITETNMRFLPILEEYWKATKLNYRGQKAVNEAWSAAFISYLMAKSGAKDKFKYAASHSAYIQAAKQNRKIGIKTFVAFKPYEIEVEEGDLICYPRQAGIKFETPGNYKAHCDIITKKTPNEIITIGGNISNSVSVTKYKLENNKIVSDKVHAIIKNYL